VWTQERHKVGETTLRVQPAPPDSEYRYNVDSELRYEKEATTMRVRGQYSFDERWSLGFAHSVTHFASGAQMKSGMDLKGWREGKRFVVEVEHNRGDQRLRYDVALPDRDAFVFLPQAFELWALLAPVLLPLEEAKTIPVCYVYFDTVYDVTLTPVGKETIRCGGEDIECVRHSVRSPGRRDIDEELWVDSGGQLIQHRSRASGLVIRLEDVAPADTAARGDAQTQTEKGPESGTAPAPETNPKKKAKEG
jgi:hypothetical protein